MGMWCATCRAPCRLQQQAAARWASQGRQGGPIRPLMSLNRAVISAPTMAL
jgi:hypothetical protein